MATTLGATGETVLAPPAVPEVERTGWLVPPGNGTALAGAIGEALALSPSQRNELGVRARRHSETFATAAMQQATLALYDRLLSRDGHGAGFSKR